MERNGKRIGRAKVPNKEILKMARNLALPDPQTEPLIKGLYEVKEND